MDGAPDVVVGSGAVAGIQQFWKISEKAVKTANPEALILAEHYGNPSAWLQGDHRDTVMNYDAFLWSL